MAARANVTLGAQIIDLNMGCPAKKVCGRLCGSALLTDETLVARILEAVVNAVDVPVTLKTAPAGTVSTETARNIACIAQECGIAALAVHGRTRADFYEGAAEYDTIRAIKARVRIPVFANGDVTTPKKAREVLDFTGADGVMIGRASHGAPWIFRAVNVHLGKRNCAAATARADLRDIILGASRLPVLFTARKVESGWRANISAGIAACWMSRRRFAGPDGAASTAAQFAHALKHFENWVSEAALRPDERFFLWGLTMTARKKTRTREGHRRQSQRAGNCRCASTPSAP